MRKDLKNRVGETFVSNEGLTFEIIEYFGNRNCTVKFLDGTIIYNKEYADLKKGKVKNPYNISVYGIGYFGIGDYSSRDGDLKTRVYNVWKNMLERCYDLKSQEKHPTYKECSVAEEWYNFQVFAEWFDERYIEDFELDKDLLVKGNKIYSSETCCFVPSEINCLLLKTKTIRGEYPIGVSKLGKLFKASTKSGNKKSIYIGLFKTPQEAFQAYKIEKEKYIKEVANKYREQIPEKVYLNLINYQVEITD